MRPLLARTLLAGLAVLPTPLLAQGVAVGAARWLSSPKVSEYRVGVNGFGGGPIRYGVTLQYLRQGANGGGSWGGVGSDFTVRTTALARPYLLGGVALGLGRVSSGNGLGVGMSAWGGVGAELAALGPMGLQAEALYSWQSRLGVRSVSVGLRLGTRIGRQTSESSGAPSGPIPNAAPLSIPSAAAEDEATIRRATSEQPSAAPTSSIVNTALSAMGTPYRWGGAGMDGFDCSGLIQYSYAQHGVTLPRRSVDQARVGSEVGREIALLLPGDILTFAESSGGDVAHVGLYLGEGRFIHSANGGVQISALSADDLAGKWWFERWVGARRVLEP